MPIFAEPPLPPPPPKSLQWGYNPIHSLGKSTYTTTLETGRSTV